MSTYLSRRLHARLSFFFLGPLRFFFTLFSDSLHVFLFINRISGALSKMLAIPDIIHLLLSLLELLSNKKNTIPLSLLSPPFPPTSPSLFSSKAHKLRGYLLGFGIHVSVSPRGWHCFPVSKCTKIH
ncbi:hypothetical protein GGS23DRAFT_236809 [Durotheca rogersii]|uniref:uncharacterized protein n=1 Tax=Durotheca rogersii TaxID=419775 RepID=UPI00221EA567|nr:uncharacterized protein GGS23DRAFT_236809 [Durotheca rogersii]KAI5860432.1 hypothetical protein GGS23DRAFT_236809 [Durotheca rogersii]